MKHPANAQIAVVSVVALAAVFFGGRAVGESSARDDEQAAHARQLAAVKKQRDEATSQVKTAEQALGYLYDGVNRITNECEQSSREGSRVYTTCDDLASQVHEADVLLGRN